MLNICIFIICFLFCVNFGICLLEGFGRYYWRYIVVINFDSMFGLIVLIMDRVIFVNYENLLERVKGYEVCYFIYMIFDWCKNI